MDKLNTLSANPVTDYVRRMHSKIEQDLYKKNVREEKMFLLMNVLNDVLNDELSKIRVLNCKVLVQLQKQQDILEKIYFKLSSS
jgi:hypothetical protein